MKIDMCICKYILTVLTCIIIAGCSTGKENVLFITKTSLGIDVDSKPPTFEVGYDRKEGTVAPVFGEGKVLPQMSSFTTDDGIVSQAIGQSFATGRAAEVLSKYIGTSSSQAILATIPATEMSGNSSIIDVPDRKRYFFGTDTVFGFKVGLGVETGGIPDSVSLGYKRKEIALVPLITFVDNGVNKVALASLIATAGLSTNANPGVGSALQYSQFFATGQAATNLAAIPEIRASVAPKIIPDTAAIVDLRKGTFFKSNSGTLLQSYWKPNGTIKATNEANIKSWMSSNGISTAPGMITMFINSKVLDDARDKAAKDLGLQ